ncbi:unnamed protein product [Schistosoma haematobium]|nr:unnamed protein product [Schistosoma haematobium]
MQLYASKLDKMHECHTVKLFFNIYLEKEITIRSFCTFHLSSGIRNFGQSSSQEVNCTRQILISNRKKPEQQCLPTIE